MNEHTTVYFLQVDLHSRIRSFESRDEISHE